MSNTKNIRSYFRGLLTGTAVFFFVFTYDSAIGQDFTMSQWFNNQIYFNPAYTGLNKGLKAKLNYRRQWAKLPGDFNMYNFSLDVADRDLPGAGGVGLLINSNKQGIGTLKTITAGIIPAVRIPLAENFVMQAAPLISIVRLEHNWDNLVFEGQLNDINGNVNPSSFAPPNNESLTYPDFSFGVLFQVKGNSATGTFGMAGHHLTRPNQSFYEASAPLDRRYVVHGDVIFAMDDYKGYFKRRISFKLNPGILYQQQGDIYLYTIGMNMYIANIYGGLWYRNESLEYDTHSDLIMVVGAMVPFADNSRLKFMYSYDLQITAEQSFTGPSHEISLVFEFDDIKLINTKNRYIYRGRKIIEETLECSPF